MTRVAVMLLLIQAVTSAIMCRSASNGSEETARHFSACLIYAVQNTTYKAAQEAPADRSHSGLIEQCAVCQLLAGHIFTIQPSEYSSSIRDQDRQTHFACAPAFPHCAETSHINNRGPPTRLL